MYFLLQPLQTTHPPQPRSYRRANVQKLTTQALRVPMGCVRRQRLAGGRRWLQESTSACRAVSPIELAHLEFEKDHDVPVTSLTPRNLVCAHSSYYLPYPAGRYSFCVSVSPSSSPTILSVDCYL